MLSLIVERDIRINTTADKVWRVLTLSKYIEQWDDLPEGFPEESLQLNTVLDWPGHAKLTTIGFDINERLKMQLTGYKWPNPTHHNIYYTYTLFKHENSVQLSLEIGDFSTLPNGEEYYNNTIAFANNAVIKIKELAEGLR